MQMPNRSGLFLWPVVDEKLGLWSLKEVPVVLINLHRDDPGRRQVDRQAGLQEIHEVRESGVVTDNHQAVEAVVLCHDDVEDLVERRKVQMILALQKFVRVGEFACNDFGGGPRSRGRARYDQRRPNAVVTDALAHDRGISLYRACSVAAYDPEGWCPSSWTWRVEQLTVFS